MTGKVTRSDIEAAIAAHELWLDDPSRGKRLDLSGTDLSGMDLSGKHLRWAIMRETNLSKAEMRWSILTGADLSCANLSGSMLFGTDMRMTDMRGSILSGSILIGAILFGAILTDARGILPVPVADPREHRWVAVAHPDGWCIAAGCHWFTIPGARNHWLSPNYDGPRSVRETVGAALDWVEQQPLPAFEGQSA